VYEEAVARAYENSNFLDFDTTMNRISPLTLLGRLRQATGIAKIPACVEWIENWLDEHPEESVVVWAHHKDVVAALIEKLGEKIGKEPLYLTGALNADQRGEAAAKFQNGESRVIVCALQAAGVGVTLTKSATAIFVEPPWNATDFAQAEDRIHRISQERQVEIIALWAADTFDDSIRQILTSKSDTHAVLGGGDVASVVTPHAIASKLVTSLIRNALKRKEKEMADIAA
jgi:SNF2 family DNA or RNA helicase